MVLLAKNCHLVLCFIGTCQTAILVLYGQHSSLNTLKGQLIEYTGDHTTVDGTGFAAIV
jgi:hypothetical protein